MEWNFGRVHQWEQFCEVVLNLNNWFRKCCHLKTFLIKSSGGPLVQRTRTISAILVEGTEEKISEIILNLDPWFKRKSSLKANSYLELWQPFLFSEAEPFVQF